MTDTDANRTRHLQTKEYKIAEWSPMQVTVVWWLVHLSAVWEDPGLNHAMDGCVYRDSRCNIQPWARAAHHYCSA